jgi:hypothetical protein
MSERELLRQYHEEDSGPPAGVLAMSGSPAPAPGS